MPELLQAGDFAYRESLPPGADGSEPVALMVHGFPESSWSWRDCLDAAARAGYRALAPDLPGFGDTPPRLPGTWEMQIEALEEFRRLAGIERAALCVHDWGGLIGLRWACDHPGATGALAISGTGFFPDGKWHGIASALRTEDEGEELIANITPELLAQALRQSSPGIGDETLGEFWKCLADADRRQAVLDLYRSGDFEKLEPYRGKLAALTAPTLITWGARDEFAPVAGAHRLAREIPGAELVVLEEAGHFLTEDEPVRMAAEIGDFLEGVRPQVIGA